MGLTKRNTYFTTINDDGHKIILDNVILPDGSKVYEVYVYGKDGDVIEFNPADLDDAINLFQTMGCNGRTK